MNVNEPRVGDAVDFMPTAFVSAAPNLTPQDAERMRMIYSLPGRVIYVNAEHRYYTVEADCRGRRLRESYKF